MSPHAALCSSVLTVSSPACDNECADTNDHGISSHKAVVLAGKMYVFGGFRPHKKLEYNQPGLDDLAVYDIGAHHLAFFAGHLSLSSGLILS